MIRLDHHGSPPDKGFFQGEIHRRQREIMVPAFSAPQIRGLLPVFQNSASKVSLSYLDVHFGDSGHFYQLSQIWKEEVVSSGQSVFNVMEWLSRMTLDNIGEGN